MLLIWVYLSVVLYLVVSDSLEDCPTQHHIFKIHIYEMSGYQSPLHPTPSPSSWIATSPQEFDNEETPDLHSRLQLAEGELRSLDVNIAIQLATRSRIVKYITCCRTSLAQAPCRKLPPEMLGMIFIQYIQDMDAGKQLCHFPLKRGKRDPRMQILQVCSEWRKVAFGIPNMWDVQFNSDPSMGGLLLVSAWFLQCSSERLVVIMQPHLHPLIEFDPGPFLAELIVPYAHRLHQLSSLPVDLGHLDAISFHILSDLTLYYPSSPPVLTGSIAAPSLRRLKIMGVRSVGGIYLHRCLPKLPWKGLTSLILTGEFCFGDVYPILVWCAFLERCVLRSVIFGSREEFGQKTLRFPLLQELEIEFSSRHMFQRILIFDAPNLGSLSINFPPGATQEMLFQFTSFSETIKGTLRQFKILSNSSFTGGNMRSILRALPNITHFFAQEQPIPPRIIAEIGGRDLLPDLEVFQFRYPLNISIEYVIEFLLERHFKEVVIFTDIRYRQSVDGWIRVLRAEGINLQIRNSKAFFSTTTT
ncbi:hypothetical protein BDZ94DRAFT_1261781 [Collybia nuda]|uniref:F-box domain-containing protein n=1 Tax=Collybia nuda TaxID=64659 RepID=A0A9P5Y4Q7_9AGAR|nr:hypothetical protein BDZ94DRAFT_1261781 [Collybia nuda]